MWARLRGVLARVGRWFLSPAGRAVWVRLLLFGASIPLAPYMVAVWRVALYGQGAEQCLLFVAVAGVLLFRGGWRRLHALRAARDEDRQSDPDRARKPVRPTRIGRGIVRAGRSPPRVRGCVSFCPRWPG